MPIKYHVNGKEYDRVTPRIREICEAEQALQVNAQDGSGASVAVGMFASIRRAEPDLKAFRIADLVMNSELSDDVIVGEEEDEESPPVEEPVEEEAGTETEPVPDLESRRTSGPRPLAAGE